MKNHNPPVVKTPVVRSDPQSVKAKQKSEFWLCEACGQDKLGRLENGILSIKYRERSLQVRDGVVRVTCRKCYFENVLDLRASGFKVNVVLHNSLVNGDIPEKEPPQKPAVKKRGRKSKKS